MSLLVKNSQAATALHENQHSERVEGYGWVSGLSASVGTSTTSIDIDLTSGTVLVDGTRHSVAAGTVTLQSGDSQHPRKDIIYVDSTGALAVETGVAGEPRPSGAARERTWQPAPPDLTGITGTPLWEVWVPAGASDSGDLSSQDLIDRRLTADVRVNNVTARGVDASWLTLSAGGSVRDEVGTDRLVAKSAQTQVQFDDGSNGLQLDAGDHTRLWTYGQTPLKVRDGAGGYTGVQYDADTSSGVLRTPGAGARIESGGTPSTGTGLELLHSGSDSRIHSYDRTNGAPMPLQVNASLYDFSSGPGNLRLSTGATVQDGGGTGRIALDSAATRLYDEGGRKLLQLWQNGSGEELVDLSSGTNNPNLRMGVGNAIVDGNNNNRFVTAGSGTYVQDDSGRKVFGGLNGARTRLTAYSNQEVQIYDNEGGFVGAQYNTSPSAPGVFDFTNASVQYGGDASRGSETKSQSLASGATMKVTNNIVDNISGALVVTDGSNNESALFHLQTTGPVEQISTNSWFSTSSSGSDGINVYYDAGAFYVENVQSTSVTVKTHLMAAGQ